MLGPVGLSWRTEANPEVGRYFGSLYQQVVTARDKDGQRERDQSQLTLLLSSQRQESAF